MVNIGRTRFKKGNIPWNKGTAKSRKIPIDAIKCELCGEKFSRIAWKHLKNIHNISLEEYRFRFPNAIITCNSTKRNCGNAQRGKKNPRHSKFMREKFWDDEKRERKRKQILKQWESKLFRKAVINGANNREVWNKNKSPSEKTKKKLSRKIAENWQDPIKRKRMLSNRGNNISPTKPEQEIINLGIQNLRFIGRYDLWLRFKNGKNKNPDFIVEGQKKVIEVFGDYWHKDDDPDELILAYKEIGYNCIVIWENEIKNNKSDVIKRIEEFV